MRPPIELITGRDFISSIVLAIFASSGFFQLLMLMYQTREKEKERKRMEETEKKLISVKDFNALCKQKDTLIKAMLHRKSTTRSNIIYMSRMLRLVETALQLSSCRK